MGVLALIAVAGVVGLACHGVTRRLGGPAGYARLILVSLISSSVNAWCFFLANRIRLGEFPEPPAGPIVIAMLSFPVALLAGIPFVKRRGERGQ